MTLFIDGVVYCGVVVEEVYSTREGKCHCFC